jgi:hypothetical protein
MSVELTRAPTTDEVEQICTAAEEAARKHLLSRVSLKDISDLDVTVEAIGDKPLVLNIDLAVELKSGAHDMDALVDEATDLAFSAADAKAKELHLCADTLA